MAWGVRGTTGDGDGFDIVFDTATGRAIGLATSSKSDSSSSSLSSSSSWNLDAIAEIEPFCSDRVGGGALDTAGVGSGSFLTGEAGFAGTGAGAAAACGGLKSAGTSTGAFPS